MSIIFCEKRMGILLILVFTFLLTITACSSEVIPPAIEMTSTAVVTSEISPSITPTQTESPTGTPETNHYQNDRFGISFSYPAGWFGPEEYLADQELRVEIGSDVVYPYGTDRTEQIYTVADSYYVVIQYSPASDFPYWREMYDLLANMKDGESRSDMRSLIIRVAEVSVGDFKGYEHISTLSETAQTERVYSRQVILFDDQGNLLVLTGSPNNVQVEDVNRWREVYQLLDEENLPYFYQVLNSIQISD